MINIVELVLRPARENPRLAFLRVTREYDSV